MARLAEKPATETAGPLLTVEDLRTYFDLRQGAVKAVDGVGFTLAPHETLAIVGESGCGKSVTALSLMRLVPDPPGRIAGGKVELAGVDLLTLDEDAMRAVRGKDIAMIFQEPMTSLNPVLTIGSQIAEAVLLHEKVNSKQAWQKAVDMLRLTRIPEPEQRAHEYPHQLSGGMRQRAMIAMALACNPSLLIADEPTTALDVTTQAEILDLIKRLQAEHGMGVMFITHDMGVVAEIADDVLVMYQGKVMESGPVETIFHAPQDSYTKMLIGSVLKLEEKADVRRQRPPLAREALPVVEVTSLKMYFGPAASPVKAVDDVSIKVRLNETLGIVGESGSGKTTVGRCLLRVIDPTAGRIDYRREDDSVVDLATADKPTLKTCRHEIRMIFQDPVSSLNPRMTVAQVIGEPLLVNGIAKGTELDDRVAELMRQVGLDPAWRERYPHAFSGGQRQRIGIARAVALQPRLIVADEPTSALDVSLRAQMLDLLIRLQDELGLAYILISHDMGVIRYMCDRVAVMFRGRVVETGSTDQVTRDPQHDYTKALLSAIPHPDPRGRRMHGRHRYTGD
jgi:peptide/nickel transport system ATP-binding protein